MRFEEFVLDGLLHFLTLKPILKDSKWRARKRKHERYGIQPQTLKLRRFKKLVERDGAFCKKCGATTDLSVDHIIPSIEGGSTELENLQILCRKCNLEKSKYENPVRKIFVWKLKN